MHLLYIDEAGDSGLNRQEPEQPVLCMAGVIVSDEKWNPTRRLINEILEDALGEKPEPSFELHAYELLSPDGEGPFAGWNRD